MDHTEGIMIFDLPHIGRNTVYHHGKISRCPMVIKRPLACDEITDSPAVHFFLRVPELFIIIKPSMTVTIIIHGHLSHNGRNTIPYIYDVMNVGIILRLA